MQCELSDGVTVAIKRAHECATVGSELQLAKLQHANVIRVLGWCIHGKERILVYEFMQNGSLDHYISDAFSVLSEISFKHTSFNS